jgi:hypothetical protein
VPDTDDSGSDNTDTDSTDMDATDTDRAQDDGQQEVTRAVSSGSSSRVRGDYGDSDETRDDDDAAGAENMVRDRGTVDSPGNAPRVPTSSQEPMAGSSEAFPAVDGVRTAEDD